MEKIWFFALCISCSLTLFAQEEEPPYYIFSIYFGGGSSYITPDQEQALYEWLDKIPNITHQDISVHSHTDDIGSKTYNEWLSRMRSEAAIDKLLKHGIREEQILIQDFGELNPVYDNSTWEGRLKNRRVDIIIRPFVT